MPALFLQNLLVFIVVVVAVCIVVIHVVRVGRWHLGLDKAARFSLDGLVGKVFLIFAASQRRQLFRIRNSFRFNNGTWR